MKRMLRSVLAVALVVGLTPLPARADGGELAGCLWMADGCGCSPFGTCPNVNCNDGGTGFCKKDAT